MGEERFSNDSDDSDFIYASDSIDGICASVKPRRPGSLPVLALILKMVENMNTVQKQQKQQKQTVGFVL